MRGLEIPAQFLMAYFLIHFRFIGLMFTSPLFMATAIPAPFRYLFAVMLTVASAGAVNGAVGASVIPIVLFDSAITVTIMVLREFLIGVALGLLTALPLTALQIAGERIGMSMAMAMANVMDPTTQQQASIIGQLKFTIGLWFYFHWNGHLLLIQSVVESVRFIPLARLSFVPATDMSIGLWLTGLFFLALRIVIPFYGALMVADIGLGFLSRTVPQMNIFVLGLPLKVALGFFVLMVTLPLTVELIFGYMERWIEFALISAAAFR